MTDCLPSQAACSWQLISILKLKQVLHSYLSRQRKQFILFHPLLHVWKMFLSIFFSSVTSSSDKTAPILLAFLFWCLNPLTLLLLTIGTHLLPCWACSLLKHPLMLTSRTPLPGLHSGLSSHLKPLHFSPAFISYKAEPRFNKSVLD